MPTSDDEFLEDVFKKITNNSHVLPDEYSRLTTLFTPAAEHATRARAFVVLSAVCDHHRRSSRGSTTDDDPGTHNILHLFLRSIESRLAEVEERPLLEVFSFVGALFAVDCRTAAAVFSREGFQDSMMDSLDLFPSDEELPCVIGTILSSACGYRSSRECLSSRCLTWLESVFHSTTNVRLKALSAVALLKSTQRAAGAMVVGDPTAERAQTDQRKEELFKSLRDVLVNSTDHVRDASDIIEGLAYLSTIPSFKARVVDDDELLRKIMSFQLVLKRKMVYIDEYGTTPFGLAVLISNLCSYRPQLTEEQTQIERLKRMAQPHSSGKGGSDEEKLDDDEHVRLRCRRLVAVGASELLVAIARATDSPATRTVVGKALLGLIEEKDNRGKVLQSGGSKTLLAIIRASQQHPDLQTKDQSANANTEFADLSSIQALAKLAITASPMQVFGPNENTTIEAIAPFVFLLSSTSSTLLQKFEAMMALTNIASVGSDLPDRIARAATLLSKLEFHLLDENHLVRRAATELICNLVSGSETAFNRFSGEGLESMESSTSLNAAKSRLHVLIALADVEDEPTRVAASGALAILTGSPTACKLVVLLEFEHHRVFPVLKSLIDPSEEGREPQSVMPNPGLVHRGVVCVRNIFVNLSEDELRDKLGSEAVRHGMVNALTKILKSAGKGNITEAALRPSAEALKWLMDSGVNVLP